MSAMPSSMQADFSAGSLPVKQPLESSPLHPGGLHGDDFDDGALGGEHLELIGRRRGGFVRLLITFCIGVGVTVAWYSFGSQAREMLAGLSPQLAWLAPPAAATAQPAADAPSPSSPPTIDQQLAATSSDIDAVRQNVDRIASSQEQIKRSIDQLATGQEQLTKEIAKLQAVEQYILYKNSEPPTPPRPAPAPVAARKPAAPMPLAPPAASPPQALPAH